MCGITGFIDYTKKSSLEILSKMNDNLIHRGPDGAGKELFETQNLQVGLAHRRLAILELSELGNQPKNYKHLWITFNGEIYNFNEINIELRKLNYQFESNSDTETILKAYDAWGKNCIEKFIGMFAFCIYDTNKEELFFARDRAGVKPLYFYKNENLLLFSSELKAFHVHPDFKKEIDFSTLALYFQYGYVPSTQCIFQSCFKLLAGHSLTYNLKKNSYTIDKYWNVTDFYNKEILDISYHEAKEKTKSLLQSACEYRMVSDVPVGVFLSGGYDSTCVAGLLQCNRSNKINTYTISVPELGMDEAPFAKQTAKHLGTNHTEATCSEKEALEIIKTLPYIYDEPFSDFSAIPTILVSQMAKKDVTVALSADGGDELFAGYNRYDDYYQFLNKSSKYNPKLFKHLLSTIFPLAKNKFLNKKYLNFENRIQKVKELFQNYSTENVYHLFHKQYSNEQINLLFKNPVLIEKTLYDEKELKKANFSPLRHALNIDYKTYLVDDILTKVDRASMSVSLEGREPFLDHRLFEYVAQLPDEFKFNSKEKKIILKDIVHDFIPKEMMDRPKSGFTVPISKWLQNDLKAYIDEYLNDDYLVKQNIFNVKHVLNLKRNFYFYKKEELGPRIWNLLMFQMWYKQWITN
jgi:asparagine synthase (glutamine-hydrolysing)